MWSHERQARILTLLSQHSKVSTNQLAVDFKVSRETARRDLLEMEAAGLLLRVHGGAVPAASVIEPEPTFATRLVQSATHKQAIARYALDLIPIGATLFIDAGTTTSAFATQLAARGQVRVITNSLEIATTLARGHDCETLLLGGRPHADVPATYGELTLTEINRFWADFAVISPVALNTLRGATNYELHEAEVARAMIQHAKSCMIMCHSTKIDTESRVSICKLDDIHHLVTDDQGGTFDLPRGVTHYAPVYTAL
jgi:DeoR/GlpR family transcriptional regulator of sugar metabolism